ncbi:Transcription initiation factor TFIID subunit 10 [Mortierella sp. NVP85]|nr:Transcription initiation factor TFIID subunit 10 [Mortierella sp. NVP85]
MSDGANPTNNIAEDAVMESPRPTQSGSSTPALSHHGSESNMASTHAGQDLSAAGASTEAATLAPTETLQHASPLPSAPSTPSRVGSAIAVSASSPMAGVVSTSTPPPVSVHSESTSALNPVATQGETSGVTRQTQDEQLQQQRLHQEQQLLMLQKQAQAQAQLAQLQQAHAAATASSSAASGSVAQHSLAVGAALQSRKEEELNRKDRTLAEFLPMMENYNPIIPDAVTDYYLSRTGFDCDDVRIKRLLALAAQKFISDIATDAFQYCKVRQQSQKRAAPGKEKKTVLTMEDLSDALGEYGINVKKPDYYL